MINSLAAILAVLAVCQISLAVKPGDAPPALKVVNQDGKTLDLAAMYGKRPVVLFFYPKSFTPKCTVEVQAFRDAADLPADFDAAVIGVSQDDAKTQRRFCDKYQLQYNLLTDKGGKIADAFGVPAKDAHNARWTVVIGRAGKVLTVDQNVNDEIKAHPKNVATLLNKDWKNYKAGFTRLFNGTNLDGWVPVKTKPDTWTVKDGLLCCSGRPTGYIRTKDSYKDYLLLVEFRYTKTLGNAGLLVHITGQDKVWPRSVEPNLNIRQMGKFYTIDGAKVEYVGNNPLRTVNVAVGKWHRYEILCRADTIEAILSGQTVNRATKANVTSGPIGVQSEGVPTQFRTIAIKQLDW